MAEKQILDRLRRGAIEPCVLALLSEQSAYAHDVVSALGRQPGLVISEGTLYPMLSRLRREGLVATEWRESPSGPPRRYYRLTQSGRAAVEDFRSAWQTFRTGVDAVLAGDLVLSPSKPSSITVKETP
ncbi:MAG: PadR family transcriptional regulator [Candidatus Nanopelagicales bacterium]